MGWPAYPPLVGGGGVSTSPISMTLHRMAPVELQELKV